MVLGFSFSYITIDDCMLLIRVDKSSKGLDIVIQHASTPWHVLTSLFVREMLVQSSGYRP